MLPMVCGVVDHDGDGDGDDDIDGRGISFVKLMHGPFNSSVLARILSYWASIAVRKCRERSRPDLVT